MRKDSKTSSSLGANARTTSSSRGVLPKQTSTSASSAAPASRPKTPTPKPILKRSSTPALDTQDSQSSDAHFLTSTNVSSRPPTLDLSSALVHPTRPVPSPSRGPPHAVASSPTVSQSARSSAPNTPSSLIGGGFKQTPSSSAADQTLSSTAKARDKTPVQREGGISVEELVGVPTKRYSMNGSGAQKLDTIWKDVFDVEFMYLRYNRLTDFSPMAPLPMLRLLDLSGNRISSFAFLSSVPNLRHLYLNDNSIASFEGFPLLRYLHTLSACSNDIKSFLGMPQLPSLQVLALSENQISDLSHLPLVSPNLHSIRLQNTPFCSSFDPMDHKTYRMLTLCACGVTNTMEIDSMGVDEAERRAASQLGLFASECIRDGWMPSQTSLSPLEMKDELTEYHINLQKRRVESCGLGGGVKLHSFGLETDGVEGSILSVNAILKQSFGVHVNDMFLRTQGALYPTRIEIECEETSSQPVVLGITGTFNKWGKPVLLDQSDTNNNKFSATLYLPQGTHYFKTCILGENGSVISGPEPSPSWPKEICESDEEKGVCNVVKVPQDDIAQEIERKLAHPQDTVPCLSIRWLRSPLVPKTETNENDENHENSLSVGADEFLLSPGALRKKQESVPQQECVLISEGDFEEIISTEESGGVSSWARTLTSEDVGKVVKVELTARGVGGKQLFALSAYSLPIQASAPHCSSLVIEGQACEGEVLHAVSAYRGGQEGNSTYRWFRLEYLPEGGEDEIALSSIDEEKEREQQTENTENENQSEIETPMPPPQEKERKSPAAVERRISGGGVISSPVAAAVKTSTIIAQMAKGSSYRVKHEDIGRHIYCEYVPIREDECAGPAMIARTQDPVTPGAPKVTNVRILGALSEFNRISVSGIYCGGKEGQSEFQWFRESNPSPTKPTTSRQQKQQSQKTSSPTEGFEPIPEATECHYDLHLTEINKRIGVMYTPVRQDGEKGEGVWGVSEVKVAPAPPTLRSLSLVGHCVEDRSILAKGDYCGGVEGKSRVQWYRVDREDQGLREPIEGATDKKYSPALRDVFHLLECRYTPVRSDGVAGDTFSVCTLGPVQPSAPEFVTLTLKGECSEKGYLEVAKEYKGGYEGEHKIRWSKRSPGSATFEDIRVNMNNLMYSLSSTDVGCTIRVECTPVRSDGVEGDTVAALSDPVQAAAPELLDVSIRGELKQGCVLTGSALYFGGKEGSRNHKWTRIDVHGKETILHESTQSTYTLTSDDVDCYLKYSAQPVRADGATGKWCSSHQTELIGTDRPRVKGLRLEPPTPCEGDTVRAIFDPQNCYASECGFQWIRIEKRAAQQNQSSSHVSSQALQAAAVALGDSTMMVASPVPLSSSSDYYQATAQDVGHHLMCIVSPPNGGDESCGISVRAVEPGMPGVSECRIVGVAQEGSSVSLRATYTGGRQGHSITRWFRVDPATSQAHPPPSHSELTHARNAKDVSLSLSDVGSVMVAEFCPIREDGAKGKIAYANSQVVAPGLPEAHDLEIKGEAMDGCTLTAHVRYTGGIQGNSIKRWYRVNPATNSRQLVAENSFTYLLRPEDVGCNVSVEFTPVREDGLEGSSVTAFTSEPILPGPPTISDVRIPVEVLCPKAARVKKTYCGGKEGQTEVQWMKASESLGPEGEVILHWHAITGATDTKYYPTADDIDCLLRADVTPVRSDGVRGPTVSSNAALVKIEPTVDETIKRMIVSKTAGFNVQSSAEADAHIILLSNRGVKVKRGDKTVHRVDYNDHMDLALVEGNDCQFNLSLGDSASTVLHFAVGTRQDRDMVALTFRSFHALGLTELAQEVLGSERASQWKGSQSSQQQPTEISPISSLPSSSSPEASPFEGISVEQVLQEATKVSPRSTVVPVPVASITPSNSSQDNPTTISSAGGSSSSLLGDPKHPATFGKVIHTGVHTFTPMICITPATLSMAHSKLVDRIERAMSGQDSHPKAPPAGWLKARKTLYTLRAQAAFRHAPKSNKI